LRISNAHGNVAIPLINRPILGDLNVQWCKREGTYGKEGNRESFEGRFPSKKLNNINLKRIKVYLLSIYNVSIKQPNFEYL
jgi:hypothetical protein